MTPTHARSAVRRLLTLGRTVGAARVRLSDLDDGRGARSAAEIAAAELVAVQSQIFNAIEDWNDVHPEALREVLGSEQLGQDLVVDVIDRGSP